MCLVGVLVLLDRRQLNGTADCPCAVESLVGFGLTRAVSPDMLFAVNVCAGFGRAGLRSLTPAPGYNDVDRISERERDIAVLILIRGGAATG